VKEKIPNPPRNWTLEIMHITSEVITRDEVESESKQMFVFLL